LIGDVEPYKGERDLKSEAIDNQEDLKETKKRLKNVESRMASLEVRLKKSEEIRHEGPPEHQEEILKLRTM